jgi:hypothetical protein
MCDMCALLGEACGVLGVQCGRTTFRTTHLSSRWVGNMCFFWEGMTKKGLVSRHVGHVGVAVRWSWVVS